MCDIANLFHVEHNKSFFRLRTHCFSKSFANVDVLITVDIHSEDQDHLIEPQRVISSTEYCNMKRIEKQ